MAARTTGLFQKILGFVFDSGDDDTERFEGAVQTYESSSGKVVGVVTRNVSKHYPDMGSHLQRQALSSSA